MPMGLLIMCRVLQQLQRYWKHGHIELAKCIKAGAHAPEVGDVLR